MTEKFYLIKRMVSEYYTTKKPRQSMKVYGQKIKGKEKVRHIIQIKIVSLKESTIKMKNKLVQKYSLMEINMKGSTIQANSTAKVVSTTIQLDIDMKGTGWEVKDRVKVKRYIKMAIIIQGNLKITSDTEKVSQYFLIAIMKVIL